MASSEAQQEQRNGGRREKTYTWYPQVYVRGQKKDGCVIEKTKVKSRQKGWWIAESESFSSAELYLVISKKHPKDKEKRKETGGGSKRIYSQWDPLLISTFESQAKHPPSLKNFLLLIFPHS